MKSKTDLDTLAEAYGILPNFRDLSGTTHPTSPDTQRALLRANGVEVDNDSMISEALAEARAIAKTRAHPTEIVVRSKQPLTLPISAGAEWRMQFEDGSAGSAEGRSEGKIRLPLLPSGIHTLDVKQGARRETITLIAAPDRCPSVEDITGCERIWGVNAALYALNSGRNRGVGDFEDLARASEAFATHGADFIGVNPVHSIGWTDRDTISPYSPSHRGFLNTLHVALDRLNGTSQFQKTSNADSDLIRYAEITAGQQTVLEQLYGQFCSETDDASHEAFGAFCASRGDALSTFALYEALSEKHGSDWRGWPAALQAPDGDEVRAAERQVSKRVRFHKWIQWLADTQLADAQARAKNGGMGLGLYLDLAVGPRRSGAESWCEQSSVAEGVALGAPPDHLSPDGQNWQLTAYAPAKLTRGKYASLRRIISDTMRHAGALRIDHVLGLNRSYWIPDDGSPGGYIKQPFEALLAIVAIEAERSGTVIIGEDLGLVPTGFRETLSERGLYSYSVLQYERDNKGTLKNPNTLRPNSLLSFGTHDTPTLKGFWTGRDIDWWQKLNWIDGSEATEARAQRDADRKSLSRLGDANNPSGEPSFSTAKDSIHEAMAASPIAMTSIQLDDLSEQVEAQNLPGTVDEHPNWRRRSKVSLENFESELGLSELGKMMRRCGRGQIDETERKVT